MRQAKRDFFNNFFQNNNKNSKIVWSLIKHMKGETTSCSPKVDINELNTFFATLGSRTVAGLSLDENLAYLRNVPFIPNTFYINPTDITEIVSIVAQLAPKTSSGYDEMSVKLLKTIINEIADPLCHVVNRSFLLGLIPDELKIARVTPIFKAGDKTQLVNYRPISILPALSKIFERLMYNRLSAFLDKYNILTPNQFGFRKNRSTADAVINLSDYVTNILDSSHSVLGHFIDVSKAFDSINHTVLLHKLWNYGVRGVAHKWFADYFANRKQFVQDNNMKSHLHHVECGVPQGSILGPLLFLIYVNDLPSVSSKSRILLFADDTTVLTPFSDPIADNAFLQTEINVIVDWFALNKLVINVSKTQLMSFSLTKPHKLPRIIITGNDVQFVEFVKFLGCYVDFRLKWDLHIQRVCSCVCKGIAMLRSVNNCFPQYVKLMLYYAMIYPYLVYCIVAWGNAYVAHLNPLITLQKQAIRLICNKPKLEHCKPLACYHQLLMVNELYQFNCVLQTFRYIYLVDNMSLSHSFVFSSRNDLHANKLSVYHSRTVARQKSFLVSCIKIWNNLPVYIRTVLDYKYLKCVTKSYFLHMYLDD